MTVVMEYYIELFLNIWESKKKSKKTRWIMFAYRKAPYLKIKSFVTQYFAFILEEGRNTFP